MLMESSTCSIGPRRIVGQLLPLGPILLSREHALWVEEVAIVVNLSTKCDSNILCLEFSLGFTRAT